MSRCAAAIAPSMRGKASAPPSSRSIASSKGRNISHCRTLALVAAGPQALGTAGGGRLMSDKVKKSNEEWRKELSPAQFQVLRGCGTERAFTGPYWNDHDPGEYLC